jgi:transglutaminase-like putative cysteine protease
MGIPSGSEGTRVTLALMSKLVREAKKRLAIRTRALSLVKNNGQKDYPGEVRDLHRFVRDNIRYVKDIHGVETLQMPEKTLEFEQGDCDDKSMLLASLLESVGHPTRFVAVGFTPGTFAHVYVETRIGDKWYPMETTEPWAPGRGPGVVLTRMVQHN